MKESKYTFWSHPEVPLEDHLRKVAREARRLLDHPALRDRERLRELAYLAGAAHDFGKFTSFFQRHLRGERVEQGLYHHGLLSALFAAHLARVRFPKDPEAWLIAYLAVHRHHGPLYVPKRTWLTADHYNKIKKQWEDLIAHKEAVRSTMEQVWEEGDAGFLDLSQEEITKTLMLALKGAYRSINRDVPSCEENPEELRAEHGRIALQVQLVYSALISADKFAAAGVVRPSRPHLTSELVDTFLARLPSSPLGELRQRLQDGVRQSLEQASLPGVFTLTAPTGSGKTLAAFRAALQIRERLVNKWGSPPRIIYALPFINLIEQVKEVLRQVLQGDTEYKKAPERFLVSHHHLADVQYREKGEERPVQEALLLVEDWESEVVVTTFMQIFHTFFGYANRWLKKLHNLVGAVLILDEPQQFPTEYWKALGWMIELLRNELGMTVVLMTATQPRILEGVKHKELVDPEVRREFQIYFNRYEVRDLPDKEVFLETLEEELRKGHSVLVVVNTIRTSLELWDHLQGKIEKTYLSTNILPLHRRERIEEIRKKLASGGPLVVVATQVVEAGVDLDFDVVFREISPLDALIQAAGRCNREGRRTRGRVYRFVLKESVRRGSLVYGRVALEVAREVWQNQDKPIEEATLSTLLETYYQCLLQRKSGTSSWCLWDRYARLFFYDQKGLLESLKDYPLIDPQPEVPVLVMLSEEDETRLEEIYYTVFREKDLAKRQEAYLRNRRWLHERTLRLLHKRAIANLPPTWKDTSFRWVSFEFFETYYDRNTGFRWRKEDLEGEVWIL